MLFKTKDKASGKTLFRSRPLLVSPQQGYTRPGQGKAWFATTTTIWRVDELIKRSVRDWRRLTDETGHTGERTGNFRKDHDTAYTGTYSVFAAPLMEWIILRYGGERGGKILDAFAGGPVRAVVSAIMGMHYTGIELRGEQIAENINVLKKLKLSNCTFHESDARFFDIAEKSFDCAITCPPYHNLEKYSDRADDMSNQSSYEEFNAGMALCANTQFRHLKPGAFMCIVVGNFRDKTGELVDFPGHTIGNFREAGFIYWQNVVLCKNFASATIRSTNAWKGKKLVPASEFLLVFRKPEK